NDTVDAGAGNDIVIAGKGASTLAGGAGHDMFVFPQAGALNVATDFQPGEDLVDVRAMFNRVHYHGSDPVADGLLAIASDGAGGLIVSVDPSHSGTMHPILDLQHVSPASFHVGGDLLW